MIQLLKKFFYLRNIIFFLLGGVELSSSLKFLWSLVRPGKITQLTLKSGLRFQVRNIYDLVPLYEQFMQRTYGELLERTRRPVTIIDIGGYIGDTAVFFAQHPAVTKVLVYEPLPTNFVTLKQNLLLNKKFIYDKITAHALAVVGRARKTKLKLLSNNNLGNTTQLKKSQSAGQKISYVATVPLAQIVKKFRGQALYLKMDCEGAELEILQQTPPLILRQISRMIIEYHLKYYQLTELTAVLKRNHYQVSIAPDQIEPDTIGIILAHRSKLAH